MIAQSREDPDRRTDEELIINVAGGSDSAVTVLFERYKQKSFRFLLGLTGGDRDRSLDLMQDVFIKVMLFAGSFKPGQRFEPWFFTIIVNTWKNDNKTAWRRYRRILDEQTPHTNRTSGIDRGDATAFTAALRKALADYSEEERLIFFMRIIAGVQVAEVSQVLQIPEGTVKSRLHRILGKLADDLAEFRHLLED